MQKNCFTKQKNKSVPNSISSSIFLSKKADTTVFLFLLSTVVLIAIIFFGVFAFKKTSTTINDSQMQILAGSIQRDIEIMLTSRGTKTYSYDLPPSVAYALLIDLSFHETLKKDVIIQNYSVIYDTVDSKFGDNFYLFSSTGNLIESYNLGKLSIGQVGNDVCTGKAILNKELGKLSLKMTHTGDGELLIGDECSSIKYLTIEGPFNDTSARYPDFLPQVDISYNKRQYRLKEDVSSTLLGRPLFFRNYTLYFDNLLLNESVTPYRFYYGGDLINQTQLRFRIGFNMTSYNSYQFFGPNLTASENDLGYYYTYPGEFIVFPPNAPFNRVALMVILESDSSRIYSPSFRWAQLGYRG